jgi:ketosteroid isomerase-like protein
VARRLVTAVLVATLFVASKSSDAQFFALEKVWNEAHLKGDVDALDRLWADDLVVAVPKMVLNKTESLNVWRSGRLKFRRYETSDLRVRTYRETAVVTGRMRRSREMPDGTLRDDDWTFTKVYVRRGSTWRVVAFQASEAPQ